MNTERQAKLAYMDVQIIERQLWAQFWMSKALVLAHKNKPPE